MKLQPIIGLEIHVQLKTKSKMFCPCDNAGEFAPPNTTICPICTGQPGTLPVMNKQAVEWTIKAGLALNCRIPEYSKFDRKNYFYPDLPKGYQISQYDQPLCQNGFLEIESNGETKKIRILRIHLEEDAAKNFHSTNGQNTLVDYNRAGTPLMEIVTEPDLRTPQDAKTFMQELRLIMKYLDISEADMEKGHMRCDANINLWELDEKGKKIAATPIVEVKNMNSFKALERAMEYEIKRQTKVYQETKKTTKDSPKTTRGWDDVQGVTQEQRTKEEAHDYRYFPEPDLPPLHLSHKGENAIDVEAIGETIPELPQKKRIRFEKEFGISSANIKTLVGDKELSEYAEEVISELREWICTEVASEGTEEEEWKKYGPKAVKTAINWLLNKLTKHLNEQNISIKNCKITPENFAEFIKIVTQNTINSTVAQKVLDIMFMTGKDPTNILEEEDLSGGAKNDELEKIINDIIIKNPEPVANYKKGKTNAIMFLVGQIMKETKGKASPEDIKKMLLEKLK